MYEAEVNDLTESIEVLPPEIRQRFAEFRDRIVARTTLPWGEHCTECVWPTCYTTCELYEPRQDGNCRQFVDGAVRVDHREGLNPYLVKVRFRQWAKLWTVGNLRLRPMSEAARHEWFNIAVGALGRTAPLPASIKPRVLHKISYLRRRAAEVAGASEASPDCFLLECYNPSPRPMDLTYTVRHRVPNNTAPFQKLIAVPPGYTRARVPFFEVSQALDLSRPFEVEIVPNNSDGAVLYFGLMDFVKERPEVRAGTERPAAGRKCKAIVWDLDNTLWDGILVEDGPEKIRIRPGVVEVIKQLDERGILHSIASKNNHADVMKVLRSAGLEEYFLYPQIHWQPKSQSISQIAQSLNIGIESLAFVDDQPFEREEVQTSWPQVLGIDAADGAGILTRPEFSVPVTAESRQRRVMYREQLQRETTMQSYQGDYSGFLRDCRMEISIRPLGEANLERVYELAQRTNQLNFSGNRYPKAQLAEMMKSGSLSTYVIDGADRFGNYGIVGFAVVDPREPRLLDLMFSCRVQGKRVEHAVFTFLLKQFVAAGSRSFYANYRRTSKNAPAGKVFEEMGFEGVQEKDGVSLFVFAPGREIPDDRIVSVTLRNGS